jgi:radical SAM protein with 4Fe4S-binding SPASM domain
MKRKTSQSPARASRLQMYLYLLRSYPKFLATGRCLDFPQTLHIQTQSFCDGRCLMCPYPTTSQKLEQGKMEWELFQKIADEAAAEPQLDKVLFELHNEPLLDKRTFDCIKYIKSISPKKSCALVTNGQILDQFSLKEIIESNIDSLMVSLDAHSKEVFERINIGLDYERVMKNIARLLSNETTKRKMGVSFVATEENAHELSKAVRYWRKQGVRTRVITEISNRGGALDRYEKLRLKTGYRDTPFLSKLWRRLMTGLGRVTGCHLPFCHMNILFNGDVIICCHDWNRATVVGNVKNSSLREVWNSPRMNEVRRLIINKEYEQLDSCRDCSIVKR